MTEPKFSFSRDKDKIQELRKMSKNQFPMMHCVKALYSADGDMQRALVWMETHTGWYLS